MNLTAATVSELVFSIKKFLENEFQEVVVQGEVSNLSVAASGHCYFSLSDEQALLSCAFFKMDFLRNSHSKNLKNGEKVIVLGEVSVYPKRGQFQLLVKRIFPAGEGLLKFQFDQLKNKLSQEGLFDLDKKRPIPLIPQKIALITSETGAAIHDFLNVLKRRSHWFNVVLIPSVVQGESAPRSLVDALKKSEALEVKPDVIVLTRGGGSLEDLWAFNNESLVRAIHNCSIPVISAIGHQVDYTLCDYVADFRAETPTAAAEKLSQAQTEIVNRIQFCQSHLLKSLLNLSHKIELSIKRFHPQEVLAKIISQIHRDHKRLASIGFLQTDLKNNLLHKTRELDELLQKLLLCMEKLSNNNAQTLKNLDDILKVLNPNNTLNRGYTYVKTTSGSVVSSLKDFEKLNDHEKIQLVFSDGIGCVYKGQS